MGGSGRVAVAVLVVLASVATVLAVGAVATQSEGATFDRNGLSGSEVASLWSRDDEGSRPGHLWVYRDILNWTGATEEDVTEHRSHETWQEIADTDAEAGALGTLTVALNGDYLHGTPPAFAHEWTRNDFRELGDFQFAWNSSIYPDAARPTDAGVIRDAHATLFTIQPSTVYHGQGGRTRYVRPSGNASGLVDYRVAVPESRVEEPDGDDLVRRVHNFSHDGSRINRTRLYADDRIVDVGSGGHTPTHDYDLRRGVDELTLQAEINASIVHWTRDLEWETEEYECENPVTGNTTTCTRRVQEWQDPETTVEYEEVLVNDTAPVSLYRLDPRAWRARLPGGDSRVVVGSGGVPFAGYRVEGEAGVGAVRSDVRFYTARNTGWDRLTFRNETVQTTFASPGRPVRVHAYRDAAGPVQAPDAAVATDDERGMTASAIRSWGPTRRGDANVTIGPRIASVSPLSEESTLAARVSAVHPDDIRSLRVRGLVVGTDGPVDGSVPERAVRDLRIDATVRSQSGDTATVHVRLVDHETGDPVALDARPGTDTTGVANGEVVIEGEPAVTVRSDADGEFTRTVSDDDAVTVRYEATGWARADPAAGWDGPVYRDEAVEVARGALDGDTLHVVLGQGIVLAVPFLFLYVLIDRGWRLFDFERKS